MITTFFLAAGAILIVLYSGGISFLTRKKITVNVHVVYQILEHYIVNIMFITQHNLEIVHVWNSLSRIKKKRFLGF